jgi:hypothetical protein
MPKSQKSAAETAKSRKTAKDLNNLKISTGDVIKDTPADKLTSKGNQITSLDQFWGFKDSKYNTLDDNEYLKQVNGMNLVDLYAHAVKLGIPPYKERDRLTKKLVNEFRTYANSFKKPRNEHEHMNKIENIPENVRRILAEGR